ncbi:ComEC/Rec2 family competence protein [uncultured Megasphaera sp.]|uniref:ComEC/Rec2 family competence protein n=1 Tax=uncultured Megasphaera sp. TaxID=165188 RepID=UPI002658B477|nr:ComEC/Rec2 family competence protein [uncultured Megasphaera sp.]
MNWHKWKQSTVAVAVALCLAFMAFLSGCSQQQASQTDSGQKGAVAATVADSDAALHVYMLNVGQADATLIQYKGQNMLIDTGDVDHRDELVKQLKEHHVKTLDAVMISHPHGDHMGGMAALFKAFPIKQIYDNGQAANTAMYKNYLKNIKNKKIPYTVLKRGDSFTFAGDIAFQVLSPGEPFTKKNTQGLSESGLTNNNSIVCKMTYGDFSILFTGDAQKEAEDQMLKLYDKKTLHADVLKVGHHGSKTSSSPAFVQAVSPKEGTISCGVNNQYKFPHKPTLDTLKKNHVNVYRTDQDGVISILSDGKSYQISKER